MASSSRPRTPACAGGGQVTCPRLPHHASRHSVVPVAVVFVSLLCGASVGAITLVSVDQEIAIGREANAQVRKEVPSVTDSEVVTYVRSLARRLVNGAPGPKYPYSVS